MLNSGNNFSTNGTMEFPHVTKNHLGLIFATSMVALLIAWSVGSSYVRTPSMGNISVQAVSWKRVKTLAEPDAGLPGRRITVINPINQTIVASAKTDSSGLVKFNVPAGNYIVLGSSDEPDKAEVKPGATTKFKLIVH